MASSKSSYTSHVQQCPPIYPKLVPKSTPLFYWCGRAGRGVGGSPYYMQSRLFDVKSWFFVLLIAFAGCRAAPPTSAKEEALKLVTQEFPCEAAILDTVIQAVEVRQSEVSGEYLIRLDRLTSDGYFINSNFLGSGSKYNPPVAIYAATPIEWTLLQLFRVPHCDPEFEAILWTEIASSKHKIEQYACAIRDIEALMDELWIGTDCGEQCWNDLRSRLERAYERYGYYKNELRYNEHVQSVYFGEEAACN